MEVTPDQLIQMIGELTVENRLLKHELLTLRQEQAQAIPPEVFSEAKNGGRAPWEIPVAAEAKRED